MGVLIKAFPSEYKYLSTSTKEYVFEAVPSTGVVSYGGKRILTVLSSKINITIDKNAVDWELLMRTYFYFEVEL